MSQKDAITWNSTRAPHQVIVGFLLISKNKTSRFVQFIDSTYDQEGLSSYDDSATSTYTFVDEQVSLDQVDGSLKKKIVDRFLGHLGLVKKSKPETFEESPSACRILAVMDDAQWAVLGEKVIKDKLQHLRLEEDAKQVNKVLEVKWDERKLIHTPVKRSEGPTTEPLRNITTDLLAFSRFLSEEDRKFLGDLPEDILNTEVAGIAFQQWATQGTYDTVMGGGKATPDTAEATPDTAEVTPDTVKEQMNSVMERIVTLSHDLKTLKEKKYNNP